MRDFAYQIRPDDERGAFREYAEFCIQEPRLAQLLLDAMLAPPTTNEFYLRFKPRIQRLVGWNAENLKLRTREAYDVVYEVIYSMAIDTTWADQS